MRIYTYGDIKKPKLMLLPGNCIEGREYFHDVLPFILKKYHVIVVSYSGFDGNDNTTFLNMKMEADMIENYVKEQYEGRLHGVYGSAIGGAFAALMLQRGNICFDKVILGGVDFDKASVPAAFLQAHIFAPIFYKMIHTGRPHNAVAKEMAGLPPDDSYVRQLRMLGVGTGGRAYVKKQSVINQFYSEWTIGLEEGIHADGTEVHFLHALKTGNDYLERARRIFKDLIVHEFDMKHEELLLRFPSDWAEAILEILEQEFYG